MQLPDRLTIRAQRQCRKAEAAAFHSARMYDPYVPSDFLLANHGSVLVLTPMSDAARAWRDEHLAHPEAQSWGRGTVIEPRYWEAIAEGIADDGLVVR